MDIMKLAGLPAPYFGEACEEVKKKLNDFDECEDTTEKLQHDNVNHYFESGMYARELLIPEGAVIVSKVHKSGCINIISKGSVIVIDSNGKKNYDAPVTFTSPAGTQRIVLALEDTVWTCVHKTDITDVDDLVDNLTTETYVEYLKQLEDKTWYG
jgi:hypothetical protein